MLGPRGADVFSVALYSVAFVTAAAAAAVMFLQEVGVYHQPEGRRRQVNSATVLYTLLAALVDVWCHRQLSRRRRRRREK